MSIVPASDTNIARAAQALRQGELVAFPTETVYGLGADATNGKAVARIFELKARPHFNPLIVHAASREAAEELGEFPIEALAMARVFWPGALTLVVPHRHESAVTDLVRAGLDTVALRVPAHPVARALLEHAAIPVAAPSANRSGHVSPTTAAHVEDDLGEGPAFILDGGPTPLGIESTVVDATMDRPKLLRPGAVPREDIETVLGHPLQLADGNESPASPGQLPSHYAPQALLRLKTHEVAGHEALLAFGPDVPQGASKTINLSKTGDLREAAANLFAALRELDATGVLTIAVMPIPEEGLGEAINDRLRRAAAPRE
jgi:L-threonylcarbamoyladenylate synthase